MGTSLVIYDARSMDPSPITNGRTGDWDTSSWVKRLQNFDIQADADHGRFGRGIVYDIKDVGGSTQNQDIILQIGSEVGNILDVDLPLISSTVLGIKGVDVTTVPGANNGISAFKSAIMYINEERSRMGSYQNRLEHTIKNLDNIVENTQAAESALRDSNMAALMVEYSNSQIIAQAGQSLMAQANQANSSVLSLVK